MLHPAFALLHQRCRDMLAGFLTGTPSEALKFWLDAHEFESSYEYLSSGWPSSETVQAARAVFRKFKELLTELCVPKLLEQIEKQVQEAPHDLFRDAKLAATNALVTQYEKFLDDPSGDAYVKEVEVSRIPRAKKKAVATSDEYADAW